MSARFHTSLAGGAGSVAPSASRPTRTELVKRRHVDLMRVCSDRCRRHESH